MGNKQRKLTNKEQKVAADILTDYICVYSVEGYNNRFVERVMEEYGLFHDPFTKLPCTPKEYADNSLEYDRQTMIERYGHCDGLD